MRVLLTHNNYTLQGGAEVFFHEVARVSGTASDLIVADVKKGGTAVVFRHLAGHPEPDISVGQGELPFPTNPPWRPACAAVEP